MSNKMMKFENSEIAVENIDGQWMFELYAVGMALGQVKMAKGFSYPRKERIDENVKSADIKPVVHNGQQYLTESQVYDLMLETRTDKCRAFRKWLTNEVLPELNRTGTYTLSTAKEIHGECERKTYRGQAVVLAADFEKLTGVLHDTAVRCVMSMCKRGEDYFYLTGNELFDFKVENSGVGKGSKALVVITKSGFTKLCGFYGVRYEELGCFEARSSARSKAPWPNGVAIDLLCRIEKSVSLVDKHRKEMICSSNLEEAHRAKMLLIYAANDIISYVNSLKSTTV